MEENDIDDKSHITDVIEHINFELSKEHKAFTAFVDE